MGINRRTLLCAGAAGAATLLVGRGAGAVPGSERAARPNILWFISEDNFPLIGSYGDRLARTPTIDRLARGGILYERAYSTSPVCGPSRFSILTGLYPETAGSAEHFGSTDEVLPPSIRGLPAWLRDRGYYCTNTAKKNYNSQFDFVEGLWDESSEEAHWRKRVADQPFFATFTSFATHESALFRPLSGNVTPSQVELPPYLPDSSGVRQDFATFYNAMEKVDGELATRLRELEDAGVAEDTIVFYFSDNGGITPRGKRFCYELGTRCPLIVYLPPKWAHLASQPPGSRINDPVSLADLLPTVLSMLGIRPPRHCQGRALLGRYRAPPVRHVFSGRGRMDERYDFVRSVTDGRFRYIRNYAPHRAYGQHIAFMFQARGYQDWEAAHLAGELNEVQERFWKNKPFEELYDSWVDPHQINNLVDDPAHRGTLAGMRAALDAHMRDVNDNGFIPEGVAPAGYVNSRRPGAYPLADVMQLAHRAASRDVSAIPEFVSALEHENEVLRYWGAQGLLILGQGAGSAAPAMQRALSRETSPAVRIALAEALVALTGDREALRMLGFVLDLEDDGPLRLQAINALTCLGARAAPVLPAIRRSTQEDHRHIRKAAEYLLAVLEGNYEPRRQAPTPGGRVTVDPMIESAPAPRFYD